MPPTRRGRLRRTASATLIVAACALLPLATAAVWARSEIGDADAYTAAMAPLATEPGVRDALADAVTAGIMREVDPDALQEGTVRVFVRDAVGSFTATDAYRGSWDTANRTAHDVVMRAVREQHGERVTIDLAAVTAQVKQSLVDDGVPFARRIPVQPTVVTVLSGEEPERLRKGVHMLELAGLWLPVGSVLLALGGILLATLRRRAVTATALGTAAAAAVLAIAIAVVREVTLGDLPPHVSRAAAGAVFDALTGSLRTAVRVILVLGLAVGLAGWAAGRFSGVRGARAAPPAPVAEPAGRTLTVTPFTHPAGHPTGRPAGTTAGSPTGTPAGHPVGPPLLAAEAAPRTHRPPARATVTGRSPSSLGEDADDDT
ncbi:hypothetical protein ACFV0R_07560 [Streptomyces sp. NPDC059578]|uniref:hypothetical protein n=1 Tax=unclassified Streptomyces TaxID=2593676 RepID=UPI003650F490